MSLQLFAQQREFLLRLFRRDQPESSPVVLTRRRIYIIPTGNGIIFSILLLAMLIGAINYQNSLAFIFTFLLTGVALITMVYTFQNIYGLIFRTGHIKPVFCGDAAQFPISISNPNSSHLRFSVKLHFSGLTPYSIDLAAGDCHWLTLPYPTEKRGWLRPGRITLYTRFPLGLFHAWAYLNFDMKALVYPSPSSDRTLPTELLVEDGSSGDSGKGYDDFSSLRPYHSGDSLRHVHWKALAREQGLVTKQFGGGVSEQLWFNWDSLGNIPIEEKLSRLTRWVIEADSRGLAYGLLLPSTEITPERGEIHFRRSLEILALYGLGEEER
ncbi:MAG: DUF58 domain-containing protein [Chromatiales bacterium]|nr:DUF58 domain-containing protein [Chromatiales bacterium]